VICTDLASADGSTPLEVDEIEAEIIKDLPDSSALRPNVILLNATYATVCISNASSSVDVVKMLSASEYKSRLALNLGMQVVVYRPTVGVVVTLGSSPPPPPLLAASTNAIDSSKSSSPPLASSRTAASVVGIGGALFLFIGIVIVVKYYNQRKKQRPHLLSKNAADKSAAKMSSFIVHHEAHGKLATQI